VQSKLAILSLHPCGALDEQKSPLSLFVQYGVFPVQLTSLLDEAPKQYLKSFFLLKINRKLRNL
jgi:hypothetical protein